ncbi:MAG TPA: hypothetical protein VGU70_18560 [Methylobacterium sp.]|jgi:hypothetical protein|uniref:hypothetical protein n=1 Tax=Methylorubrum sp. B1-46 TaxID=2897334 RepID=UPI001E656E33|nr:hypothetical protein [Methylorubrum sp. B1-46]UGB27604.1 hypothetical protein LPC10_08585 [Methylorubrum sp. B1-46]HEV2544760.1 hypothetical protein [Methylobacterium sp.]
MTWLGRLLLSVIALILAIPAGALTLSAGVLLDPTFRQTLGELGLVGLFAGLSDLAQGLPPDMAVMAVILLAQALGLLLILPPTLTALVGETLGLRSPFWYGGATGLLTALLPWLARGGPPLAAGSAAAGAETRLAAILLVTGAASGLVYWLIAGRSAGARMARRGSGAF